MLYCNYEDDDLDNYFFHNDKFSKLETTKRKRCCSCNSLINIGDTIISFKRARKAITDIEEKIYGDEVSLANHYMCEKCSEIYLNLTDIGYNIHIDQNMNECLNEYHILTGFKK